MRILSKILALIALSALPLAAPPKPVHAAQAATAVQPQPYPIQTVVFNTWELPAYVDFKPIVGGLTYDVFMTTGACTQHSVASSTPRIAFSVQNFTAELDQYGTYCFYVNAWTANYTYLPATILTTVNVVQVPPPTPSTQANTTTQASQINSASIVHN